MTLRKAVLASVAGMAVALASIGMMAGAPASHQVEVRPAQPAQPQAPAQTPSEKQALREERADARTRRWRAPPKSPVKNRAGGERAHRRWRKAKASGKRAA